MGDKELKAGKTGKQPPAAILPADFQARFEQALAHQKAGRLVEAEALYKQILQTYPTHADSLQLMGMLAHKIGRSDIGVQLLEKAIALRDDQAIYYTNYGVIAQYVGKVDEALRAFRRAIALEPNYALAHWSLGILYLLRGNFRDGWREFEWRWQVEDLQLIKLGALIGKPIWDGGDPAGKTILLYCEQGAGDSIQFVRYAKILCERGAKVRVLCPPSLARLFETAAGIELLIPEGDIPLEVLAACDAVISMLSVPGHCKTGPRTIPAEIPYLRAAPALADQWRERFAGYAGLKIGIVWRGNPTHENDRNRSMRAAQFAEFLRDAGATVFSLQKDATPDEIAVLGCVNLGMEFTDFADTAAALVHLDLVITVDTSVCHLAGALGLPVWTLLPRTPDWRWMMERGDSPWYPNMRLFRQNKSNDWSNVIADIAEAIAMKKAGA